MRYSSRTEIAIVQERPVRAAGARYQADRNARRFGLFVRLSLLLRKPTPLPNNLVWRFALGTLAVGKKPLGYY